MAETGTIGLVSGDRPARPAPGLCKSCATELQACTASCWAERWLPLVVLVQLRRPPPTCRRSSPAPACRAAPIPSFSFQAMPPSMQSLPEELQGRILELAGQQAGPSVTLVCKHRLVYSQPGLWQQVAVLGKDARQLGSAEDNWWHRKLALLQRVRGAVRAAQFEGPPIGVEAASAHALPDGMQLADLVGALDPAALTSLTFSQKAELSPAAAHGIVCCTRLRPLDLSVLPFPLREESTAVLQQLGSLQQLTLSAQHLPALLLHEGVASCLLHLTGLTLKSDAELPSTQPLTALTRLQKLTMRQASAGDTGLQLLPVTAFPALKAMSYIARHFQVSP